MEVSHIRLWRAALAAVIIAGAASWYWHDRGTSGSGAPAAARPAIVPEPVGGPGDNHYRQRGAPTTYVTAFH
ncbi:hypothetical protein IRC75_23320 [Klebsiella pneumoniae]|nr:hypothetical protein [Klebsiella pneumoniae]TRV84983.1 hypothetical protein FNZ00_23540 [Klebsiella pneumoniae]